MSAVATTLREHAEGVRETVKEYVRLIEAGEGEPVVDETPIWEYPLEVVREVGRPWTVLVCTGGPHIEITADGPYRARLDAYWGGEHVVLHHSAFDTFLDHLTGRDDQQWHACCGERGCAVGLL